MRIPEVFPAGCVFVAGFSGDEYVRFPDGAWFRASDDGASLVPLPGMDPAGPRSGAPMSEAAFLSCAARSRAFAAGGLEGFLAEREKAAS